VARQCDQTASVRTFKLSNDHGGLTGTRQRLEDATVGIVVFVGTSAAICGSLATLFP
jgi:hypothetical protein